MVIASTRLKHSFTDLRYGDNLCFGLFLFDRDFFLFQLVWVIICRHRFHSIKRTALAYHISNDIIPAAFIHLNLEKKVTASVFSQMLLSWKFYYGICVGKTHNQYFPLTRWQRTSGATYEPQAGADVGKYIFRGGRQYLILTHHLIITIILQKKKGSGIFYVTFEVPASPSHLSFHLRLQRVNTLLCFQEVS